MAIIDPEGLFHGERLAACSAPTCAGIYVIFIHGKLVYIGKSINVRKRVNYHRSVLRTQGKLNWHHLNGCVADDLQFRFIVPSSPNEVDALERRLIEIYRPPLNRHVAGRQVRTLANG